mgnify:CR=1 FL=1
MFWFRNIRIEVYGLEPDKRNAELINKKMGKNVCKVGIVEDFETEEKFDIIWSSHVFEHVLKPKLVLKKLKNYLKDDGFAYHIKVFEIDYKSFSKEKQVLTIYE